MTPPSRRDPSRPPPLAGLRFSLVGPGRVGSSVARWLVAAGARLEGVAGPDGRSPVPRWATAAGARLTRVGELTTGGEDLLLIAVPDAQLPAVAATLAASAQAAVALHTSGALPATTLAPLAAGGTRIGGFHPLRAFPRPLPSPAVARRTFFALDGDPAAVELGQRLAAGLGATAAPVPGGVRPLYHLAATLAAGGTVTLVAAAATLHGDLGVAAASRGGLLELAAGALAAADPARPAAAITGPLARGEERYLDQLALLRETAPELHPLAVVLALESLRQLALEGSAGAAQHRLRQRLQALCSAPGFLDPLLGRV